MSLRLACDLDGVLADLEGAIEEAAGRLFGPMEPSGRAAQQEEAPPRSASRRERSRSVLGLSDFRSSSRPSSPAAASDASAAPSEPGRPPIRAVTAVGGNQVPAPPSAAGQPLPGTVPTLASSTGALSGTGAPGPLSGTGAPERTQAAIDGELAAVEAALVEALKRPLPGVGDPREATRDPGEESVVAEVAARPSGPGNDLSGERLAAGPASADDTAEGAEASAVSAVRSLSDRQQSRLWREVRSQPNFWETLNEIEPGAVARLAVLAENLRWEVIFITQRPSTAGDTCQVQTQRWLERHGFARPSVFVIRGSRGRVATALDLDVVIDDRPENSLDVVVDSKARSVLVWRGDPASPVVQNARRMGIHVYTSVVQCLEALADPAWGKPTLLGRIKGLFRGSETDRA